jgi:YHS domain-containing protein
MKSLKLIAGIILTAAFMAVPQAGRADGTNSVSSTAKPKPDLLTTCPVSGNKLGEMGKPLIFVYQGQEIKLCCGGCKKAFDKDPAKYIKKIREADKDTKN